MPQGRYDHEKGKPTVPQCGRSRVSISFDGKMLVLRGPRLQFSWAAASGRPESRGNFDYSANRQKIGGTGPIPAGEYWINPTEVWERPWYAPQKAVTWGDYRVTLHVMPGTETHGRGGFFIHGGSVAGSAGCIDLTADINRFMTRLREPLRNAPNCYVPVTVRY
jgi:hypothetical protein